MPLSGREGDDRSWLIVGRAAKPHGVHGDVLVEIITDFPERLTDGVRFGLGGGDEPTEFFEVHRVRFHQGRWLLSVIPLAWCLATGLTLHALGAPHFLATPILGLAALVAGVAAARLNRPAA